MRGKDGKGDFGHLQQGIERVTRFVFSESYHLEKAISHAAKAAYLSRLIASDKKAIEKFEDPAQVKDLFFFHDVGFSRSSFRVAHLTTFLPTAPFALVLSCAIPSDS